MKKRLKEIKKNEIFEYLKDNASGYAFENGILKFFGINKEKIDVNKVKKELKCPIKEKKENLYIYI